MEYQVCTRCVMDNSNDPYIRFNPDGTCNYCSDALTTKTVVKFDQSGDERLKALFDKIKADGTGKKYDCMMGLSGGLDSAYAAYLAYKHGLRVLMVHIDDGFDTPIATANIKRLCEKFNFDLIFEKPDKQQFADLTRAFILAGLPDIAIPQDNVLLKCLYNYAQKNKIKYFLSGANFSLESITQYGMDATDKVHILDVHKKFGQAPLKSDFPLFTILEKRLKYAFLYRVKTIKPLNSINYNASHALKELKGACGFEYYGSKHWESRFTKFMLVYYLPKKFSIDKRRSHFSSMIVSGQMTRAEAIEKLAKPMITDLKEFEEEKKFILDQLGITQDEFGRIMNEPPRLHSEFKTSNINRLSGTVLNIRKKVLGY